MNEPTIARTSGPKTAQLGWPIPAARSDAAPPPPATGRSRPDPASVDRVEVGRGDTASQAYAKFSFNEKTGAVSIRIVDARTDEVIREIPPERVAMIAEELQALARRNAPGGRSTDSGPSATPGIPDGGVDQYA